jgi:hypothetical protein
VRAAREFPKARHRARVAARCRPIIRSFVSARRLAGALAVVPAVLLYATTARADVSFWDTGEMQTVPWIAGIAHPTGFPLFVMGGWLFAHALPVGTIAWRMALFSGLAVAGAGWLLFGIVADETGQPWLGAGAAIAFETANTVWSRATRAEVHDLALLCIAATIYFSVRLHRDESGRNFVYAVGALAAGLAVHPVAIFAVPGLLALAIADRRKICARACAAAAVAATVMLATYAYLPIRSAIVTAARLDPTLQLGLNPGAPFWDYAHPADLRRFVWLVSGAQFRTSEGFGGFAHPLALLHAAAGAAVFLRTEFGIVTCVFALAGIVAVLRRDRVLGAAYALYALAGVPFAFAYVQEADPQRYLLTFEFVSIVLAALGVAALTHLGHRVARIPRAVWPAVGLLVFLAIGARNVYRNLGIITVNADPVGRKFLAAVATASPPGSVVVADWTYATALAYGAYADGTLGKRIVVAMRLQDAGANVLAWSRHRCVLVVSDVRTPDFAGTAIRVRLRNAWVPYIFAVESNAGPPCRDASESSGR